VPVSWSLFLSLSERKSIPGFAVAVAGTTTAGGEDAARLGISSSKDEGTESAAGDLAVADKERGGAVFGGGVGVVVDVVGRGRAGEEEIE
jgi:hypothetical protein